ncbi:hypothetical protein N7451_012474 [Penicillium sp. IBT 35674x]|nr:hypothetical protein N7451_012474 [Penicillium sp. IBT 35674x]
MQQQQTLVSDANLNESTKPYSDENHSEAIPSIEKNDIEMTDFGANRKTEDQQQPTQNGTLGVQNDPNHSDMRSSREQSIEFRISELKDRGVDGKKSFRYTSENVAGVFGAAFEDTGSQRGIRGFQKTNFERLCYGREATEAKIKEVWDNQEKQYVAWAQTRPGNENRSRATTPCPLNASLIRLQGKRATSRRATSRLRTPDIRISAPAVDGNGTPPSSRQNEMAGTRSNPVSLDEEKENVNSPAPSGLTPAIATSRELNNRGPPEPQRQTPIVEISRAEFMKKRGSEKWKDMDLSERQKEEVVAEALYEIYKAAMLQNNGIEVKDLDMPASTEEDL